MTTQIAEHDPEQLDPLGVGVVLEAEHLCMRMRGVEKQNSRRDQRHARAPSATSRRRARSS